MNSFNSFIINKDNLIYNINKIQYNIGDDCKICAVLKADAYGLGIKIICSIIKDYVDYFAVSNVLEAKTIREITNKKIIILTPISVEDYYWCSINNIDITLTSIEEVKYIVKNIKTKLRVHIKINTGMNRYGFNKLSSIKQSLLYLNNLKNVEVVGVFTHFSRKNNYEFVKSQYNKFLKYINACGLKNVIKHCSSSYHALNYKEFKCDMVRIGFSLYGMNKNSQKYGLKPVLEIKSEITQINEIGKNQFLGYENFYIAKKHLKIGVVPIGYADGFSKVLSNNFNVLINGKWCKVIGKVCMDCFFVDITNLNNVFIGSEVCLLGKSENKNISLLNYSFALKSCEYEALINFRRARMNQFIVNNKT